MSAITTHVLDTSTGRPGRGISVALEYASAEGWQLVGSGKTDDDGRLRDLIPAGEAVTEGSYRLTFQVGQYFMDQGVECFFPQISITFEVKDAGQRYHVPLLVSPFGYSTYRGS